MVEDARETFSDLELEEVEITRRPEVAIKYRVMATPAIAINGRLEFRGVPREDALLARLHDAAEREQG